MDNASLAKALVKGSIEAHVHSSPDVFPRLLNDIEVANQAKEAGMRAVLTKSHVGCTVARAAITTIATGFPVYGGITLNHPSGGLNPEAARVSIEMGAKKVWMPTIHAEYYLKTPDAVPMFGPQINNIAGISLINDDKSLKDELKRIVELIAKADIALGTGHVSPEEAHILAEYASKNGVNKVVITHPTSPMMRYTPDEIKEAFARGAWVIEQCFGDTTNQMKNPVPASLISDTVKLAGAERNILSTDTGQVINPPPVEAMETYIRLMLDNGITEDDIRIMTRDNPAKLLGI
jgi:hypothetical protein